MSEMTEQRAREILRYTGIELGVKEIRENGVSIWMLGDIKARLFGEYAHDELDAIAFWMRRNA